MKKEDTHTFVSECGVYRITIKPEFMKDEGVDPAKTAIHVLFTRHNLASYLHNPYGFASEILLPTKDSSSKNSYWVNGKRLSNEEGAKLAHDNNFNNKVVDKILNE